MSECDYIWRQGVYRGEAIKMKLLGWVLIQYDWSPDKKRLGLQDAEGRLSEDTERRRQHLQAKEMGLRRNQTCRHLGLGLLTSKVLRK